MHLFISIFIVLLVFFILYTVYVYFDLMFLLFLFDFLYWSGYVFFLCINMRTYLCLQYVYGYFTLEFVPIPTLARLRSSTSV